MVFFFFWVDRRNEMVVREVDRYDKENAILEKEWKELSESEVSCATTSCIFFFFHSLRTLKTKQLNYHILPTSPRS